MSCFCVCSFSCRLLHTASACINFVLAVSNSLLLFSKNILDSEALQNTYIAIWRSLKSFRAGRASPITWFVTIARNKSIDQLRKTKNVECYGRAIYDIAEDRPGADETVIQAQAASALGAYVAKLSTSDAELVSAIFDEHLTYLALANRLGSPLNTVKSRVRRILLAMRSELLHGT